LWLRITLVPKQNRNTINIQQGKDFRFPVHCFRIPQVSDTMEDGLFSQDGNKKKNLSAAQ